MCEGFCVLLHTIIIIISARTQSRMLTRALKIRLPFSSSVLSEGLRIDGDPNFATSSPLSPGDSTLQASHPGARRLPPSLHTIPDIPPVLHPSRLLCSSEVQAPDQGVSWTSLCGGVLNVSSWKETQRSLSGPGEAGGEGGLVLDYQWKMEGIPHITDVSYQCP